MLILFAAWLIRAPSSLQFYSENTGMSYIMLSELPGELEAGTWWGKMFIDRRATPPTENPHVGPQRELERSPASRKRPHQQIWSAATVRLGHNSEGAYFNQRHASFPTSFQALRVDCTVHERKHTSVAEAPWDRRNAERADWFDTHTDDDVCSAGMADIDCCLLNRGQEERLSILRRAQLDSAHSEDCAFLFRPFGEGSQHN